MCLSTVYIDKKDKKNILVEEASSINVTKGSGIMIKTLFGKEKELSGYIPAEVNLLDHYVVLVKTGGQDAAKRKKS
jgi:hypothetical protein